MKGVLRIKLSLQECGFSFTPLTQLKVFYLKAAYNLSEWQSALVASDEGGGGKPEHFVQVGFNQPVKTCCEDIDMWKKPAKQAQARKPG